MDENIGSKVWFIPDGFYHSKSNGNWKSHEAICILNPNKTDAEVRITLFFEDRDKMEGFEVTCKSERTNHVRMDKLVDGEGRTIPMDTPYAVMITSNLEIIIQYSRLDSSQAELALMTTIAYPMK